MKTININRDRLALAAILSCCLFPSIAFGAHGDVSLSGSNFEIDSDANLKVDHAAPPSEDWANVPQGDGEGFENRQSDAPSGSGDDAFGQGAKEDTPVPSVVSGSIPPNKSDLKQFGVYLENTALDERYLHMYWTRVQDPSGTTNMDFEFNQSGTLTANGVTPVRTYRDMLIQYDLSNGGTVPTLFLSFWEDGTDGGTSADCEASNKLPCWGEKIDLSSALLATGSINLTAIPSGEADGLGALSARTFGEASIDFGEVATAMGTNVCLSFGSVYLKSRSSDSFTSALKDFIAPKTTNVSNCAGLKIVKQDDADPSNLLGGAVFEVWIDDGDETYEDDQDGVDDGDGGRTYNAMCTTADDTGSCTVPNLLAGKYWVIEVTAPDGHNLADPDKQLVTIEAGGEEVVATFTNPRKPAKLVITKRDDLAALVDGAVFDLWTDEDESGTFDDQTDTYTGKSCTSGATTTGKCEITGILPPGFYCVVETEPAGYGSADPQCFELDLDETLNLTFTNPRLPAKLVITKQDDEATLVDGAVFALWTDEDESGTFDDAIDTDTGKSCTSGDTTTGKCEITSILPPGFYCVVESEPAGYGAADPQCFELDLDQTLPLTFTNPRLPAKLVITKQDDEAELVNGAVFSLWADTDESGTFDDSEDTNTGLSCTSGDTTTGKCEIANILPPGKYCVVETEPAGYEPADPQCFELSLDQTLNLTFTNPRVAAKVVITKQDDQEPPALVDGAIFALWTDVDESGTFDDGTDTDTGRSCTSGDSVTGMCEIANILPPGFYCVVETEPDGYGPADPQCFELELEETVNLTFENARIKGAIKVTKTRKHKAAANPSADPHEGVTFTVKDRDDNVIGSGATDANGVYCLDNVLLSQFAPGDGAYVVTETVPAGYSADQANPQEVSVSQAATCGSGDEATLSFANTPLTDFTISIDSQVDGGTQTVISCDNGAGGKTVLAAAPANGDGSHTATDLLPGTYTCTIEIDP